MQTDFRNEWLSQLGQRLHIQDLEFDQAGLCQLSLDQELAVTIYKPSETADMVLFGQLPVSFISPQIMQRLLVENRNHSKSTTPVLSISAELDAIEVHLKLNQSELQMGEDHLARLIHTLEYWRDQLEKLN